jgi:hypothetical protein
LKKGHYGSISLKPCEIERRFLDAVRIIIQSGYAIEEKDFKDILVFIGFGEVEVKDKEMK